MLSALYGTGITLFLVLKITVGERWALIGLFDSFLPLLLLPSLALLPVCALWRRWRLVALMTFAALMFGIGYGTTFVPRPPNTAADGPATSILTYNVHSESQQFTAMIEVIRSANADIVALQELSPAAADLITQELISAYPYQALHPNEVNPIWGQGVLSRYPIRSDEYWHISLGHQRVTIDVRGTQLTLYNTHPIHPFLIREGRPYDPVPRHTEIVEVLNRAAKDSGPVIILGDFNMSDQTDDYRQITERYRDTYREVGWGLGFTFPDFSHHNAVPAEVQSMTLPVPLVTRLDYIFHSSALESIEARVWPTSGGSDHRPLFARLAFVNGSP